MEVTGYKWNTLQAAQNAQNAARAYFLDARPPGNYVTTEWFEPLPSYKVNGDIDFYYFEGDISPVLGTPTTFTVRFKEVDI